MNSPNIWQAAVARCPDERSSHGPLQSVAILPRATAVIPASGQLASPPVHAGIDLSLVMAAFRRWRRGCRRRPMVMARPVRDVDAICRTRPRRYIGERNLLAHIIIIDGYLNADFFIRTSVRRFIGTDSCARSEGQVDDNDTRNERNERSSKFGFHGHLALTASG